MLLLSFPRDSLGANRVELTLFLSSSRRQTLNTRVSTSQFYFPWFEKDYLLAFSSPDAYSGRALIHKFRQRLTGRVSRLGLFSI